MRRMAKFATTRPRDADAQKRDGASGLDRHPDDPFESSKLDSDLEKLRSVIELTAAYYWELDRDHRFSQIWHGEARERRKVLELLLGKARWEAGGVPINYSWADHRAVLEAGEPFDDLIVEWAEADGSKRYLKSTGRPRFDADGRLLGYLGITQDVTSEVQRHQLRDLELALTKRLASNSGALEMVPIMRLVCEALGWDRGEYWERDAARGAMRLRASTAQDLPGPGPHGGVDDASGGETGGAVREGAAALSVDDILNADLGAVGSDPSRSFAVPLVDRREVFGVLRFQAARIDQPRDQLAVIFGHLANQIRSARERERMLEELRESEERFASTVDLAAIGICHVEMDGRIIHVNRRMIEILGYSRDELLGKTVREISHPEDRDVAKPQIEQLIAGEVDSFRVEKRYLRKNGDVIWVRINAVGKWDKLGNLLHHISVVEDISERKAAEARIEHLATHDALTGLPNRSVFNQMLNKSILARGRDGQKRCAVLFLDLDRFKPINDTLGHQAGDALLKAVAKRIKNAVRATDCVARFGGDEFVVLLDDFESVSDAELIASKILAAVQKPIRIGKHDCRVTGSIGYAVCPEDGSDAHVLMRYADVAMYAAKQAGRNAIERYADDMTTMSVRQISLETHLRSGLEREEFRLQYQPRVACGSGRIVAAEALLRWWNSELGTIPPVQFVPIAEETGLIVPIGEWALRAACAQCAAWQRKGLEPIAVSVNLSVAQFLDPELVLNIRAALEGSGLAPEWLELELGESTLTASLDRSAEIAAAVKKLGVRIAVDDAGSAGPINEGLAGLSLDTLKIDRSLTRDTVASPEDREAIASIVAFGRRIGAAVVAEGVEHEEQRQVLAELGCDEMQGFLFGKPCHPRELARRLADGGGYAA